MESDGCPVRPDVIATMVQALTDNSAAAIIRRISSQVAMSSHGQIVLQASVEAAVATHRLLATDILAAWTTAAAVDPSGVTGVLLVLSYLNAAITRPR